MEYLKLNRIIKEIKLILIMILSLLIFRSIIVEPFRIPSGSMIPTLLVGDFILVNKFSYGLKLPFSDITIGDNLIDFKPVYLFGKKLPERGDVVVFKFPTDPKTNFIKRIVGMPGDELEVKNKVVYINGNPLKTDILNKDLFSSEIDEKNRGINFKYFKEKVGNKEHTIQIDQDNFYKLDSPKIKIPAGKYFMMGDNRDNSFDSRGWGLVSFDQIKGKAILVWLSFTLPIGENQMIVRPWRVGKEII